MSSMDVQDYVTTLQDRLQQQADPAVKVWWEGYVKGSAPFRGVRMPVIRSVLHDWHKLHIDGVLDPERQRNLALQLFCQGFTEEKLAGILYFNEILLPQGAIESKRDLRAFAGLFAEGCIHDWNVCDWFCIKVLGSVIRREGMEPAAAISTWRKAVDVWQARSSLVAFVKVAGEPQYYPMIRSSCEALIRREERFAKTAVGWILRDISKKDPAWVVETINGNLNYFSSESLRNAVKYMETEHQVDLINRYKALH